MKQAFLIGAFQNPQYLEHLVNTLDSSRSNIYIHINKYNECEFDDFKVRISERKNIHFYSEIRVKYGSYKLLESSQLLLNEAMKDSENSHFHFISGQDILIKPIDKLCDFFENNVEISYVDCVPYPKSWDVRLYNHHIGELFEPGNSFGKYLSRFVNIFERLIGFKRKPLNFENLYIGSPWWSINREAAMLLLDYFSDKSNWERLKYTWGIEEIIIPTVLGNKLSESKIVKKNKCYIDWSQSSTSHPNCLIEEDFNKLINSDCFFARKVDPKQSLKLIEKVDNYIS